MLNKDVVPAPVVPAGMVITEPAISTYPKFSASEIHITGDSAKGRRNMRVSVPLCRVDTDMRIDQWYHTWDGDDYNTIQAAYVNDKAVFTQLCVAVGCPTIDLSTIPDNLSN